MKKESASFTAADVPRFFDEIAHYEVKSWIARLGAVDARLRELAPRINEETAEQPDWNAKEILAHMAVLSQAYGVFAYMIASGKLTELALKDVITQRDDFGAAMAARPVAEIVEEIEKHHRRTVGFLEKVTLEQLRSECRVEHGVVTPENLIRLPLVAHLEQHLEQLEVALAGNREAVTA
jgi:hypothetical protein